MALRAFDRDVLLAEYRALREEILHNDRLIIEVFTFSIISSGALIGYSTSLFSSTDSSSFQYAPFIALIPLIIIIPCTYLLTSLRLQIIRLGSYIRAYIETKLDDLNYEGAVAKLAKSEKGSALMKLSMTPISLTYIAIFLLCWIIFFAIYPINFGEILEAYMLIPIVILIISAIFFFHSQYSFFEIGNKKETFYNQWRKNQKH